MDMIYAYVSAYIKYLGIAVAISAIFSVVSVILLCKIFKHIKQNIENVPVTAPAAQPLQTAAQAVIPKKQEFIAAVTAAIAEDLGKDVSGIRILSVTRV